MKQLFKKTWQKKTVGAFLLTGFLSGLFVFFYLLTNNRISLFYNTNYQPEQPIPFSHKLHAGEYKIDCRYCHTGVETGRRSTLPSLNICMNCHRTVKTESPWIKKISLAYSENKAVAWQKVHLLPDFVRFSHFHHIKAGKDCRVCHGPVETMDELYQKESLSMGFCVNCHRQAPEEGKFIEELKGDGDHSGAPINCSNCHY